MTPGSIHVGAGTLILNPDTTPITIDSSSDGATLTYSAELEAISIDQILSPVGYFVPGEECMFETLIAEGTCEMLKLALGATDQTVSTVAPTATDKGYDEIKFGGNYVLTEYVMEYRARKRTNKNLNVVVRLYKVAISPNLELAYTKDGVSYYKLTLKAMADTTKDYGEQLGYYRQENYEATGGTAVLAVDTTTPADDATGVAVDTAIVVEFNKDIKSESVNEGNFVLLDATPAQVACTVAFTGTGATSVTITPDANLSTSTEYTFVVSENVKDINGNGMSANYIFNFTTTA